jgi:FRG domain
VQEQQYTHTVKDYSSWQEFKADGLASLYDGQTFIRGRFLFRGQGSAAWHLESSFDRWFKGDRLKKNQVADRLIELFQSEAEGLSIERDIWSDQRRRLALAQHHGVPTRLVDWTESPYVAAFFAFGSGLSSGKEDTQVAIWCLDTTSAAWAGQAGVEIINVPSYDNDRLRNQLGWFTFLTAPYSTLEQHVSFCPDAQQALRKFTIPVTEARMALSDLEMMGMSYSKIFPGLDGCARTAVLRTAREQLL